MSDYICCQGVVGGCLCIQPGKMGESSCPEVCLCLESVCCLGLAVSGTRAYVGDRFQLRADECDNRLIRLNNCLQVLSCICDIAAIFMPELRDLARLIRLIADIIFWMTQACMQAQVDYELTEGRGRSVGLGDQLNPSNGAVKAETIADRKV